MAGFEMIRKALLGLLALLLCASPVAAQQAAQWNYGFPAGSNQATATYPGDVVILGACSGCGGGAAPAQLNVAQTWTALQTFNAGIVSTTGNFTGTVTGVAGTWSGTGSFLGSTSLGLLVNSIGEHATVFASAPTATLNTDVLSQSVSLFTTSAANNWTLNIRGNSSTTLNSAMAVAQSVTVAIVTTQGATAFYNNVVQIDGTTVTPKWQGGAPSAGNINGLDVYTYTVIKTAASTYTVLASQVQFK
jgi:hypothetical protein